MIWRLAFEQRFEQHGATFADHLHTLLSAWRGDSLGHPATPHYPAALPGRVRILFQPAEETFNGARQLIDAGAREGVQAIFGLHNAPDLPLGTLPSRVFSSLETVVLNVTRFTAGNTWNVLPQSVELEGTVRIHNREIREQMPHRITALIQGIAVGFGASAELEWIEGSPALINTPAWMDVALERTQEKGYLAERAATPQMGGEAKKNASAEAFYR